VTETSAAQGPGNTTSITNRTATVQVTPATTESSSSTGLPAWGWVLIGLGAVLIGLVMFMLGRHRSSAAGGPTDAR
jgi:amino acid transporter